jgi:bifunctional non-homologous end joining protein LigD
MVLLRGRVARRGIGAIEPCLPSPAKRAPAGPGWIHEIKHDGFRLMARRDGNRVRLLSRKGNDLSQRFPFLVMAVAKLPARSCLIDGEAIVCDEKGLAVFDLIRAHGTLAGAVHCAFDLLELDGEDLRRRPIEERKQIGRTGLLQCQAAARFQLEQISFYHRRKTSRRRAQFM